jgi:hypothetical protein
VTFHPTSPTNSQPVTGKYFAPSGLTGATAASRYVGGTTSGAPTTGTFATGDFIIDEAGLIWICTVAGSPGTWVLVRSQSLNDAFLRISGTLGESIPRWGQAGTQITPASGTLYLTALALPAGVTCGHIAFCAGDTPGSSLTHWWFALYDSSLNQLAVTADQLTAAWNADNYKSLAIATIASGASATFTTTYTGLHYAGVMVAASGTPTLVSAAQVNGSIIQVAPVTGGTSDTSQGAPPSFPHAATSISPISTPIWGAVLT